MFLEAARDILKWSQHLACILRVLHGRPQWKHMVPIDMDLCMTENRYCTGKKYNTTLNLDREMLQTNKGFLVSNQNQVRLVMKVFQVYNNIVFFGLSFFHCRLLWWPKIMLMKCRWFSFLAHVWRTESGERALYTPCAVQTAKTVVGWWARVWLWRLPVFLISHHIKYTAKEEPLLFLRFKW